MPRPISVIIVDDSRYIRELFSSILSKDPNITVLATAHDPYDARAKIKQYNPDVITLDVEMPKMDGISFLKKIITLRPMPVVMVSTLTQKGADTTLQALDIGAVDYIGKPADMQNSPQFEQELVYKVKTAALAKVRGKQSAQLKPTSAETNTLSYTGKAGEWLIAIGASTGGVEALRDVLCRLPENSPPVVITQHMPAMFTAAFAQRLNKICALTVQEATQDMPILPGNAYIACGSHHLRIEQKAAKLFCRLDDGDLVSGHKPSVDVLFESVAEINGRKLAGAILTGMGKDGAKGLLTLLKAGAKTLGESEASCVVYGMPKAAFDIGAVQKQCHLRDIPSELMKICT